MTKDYAFDTALPAQLQRLRTLEEIFDAGTFRHLEALGVNETHRCLEIGAGGGSVATWLSERAGSVDPGEQHPQVAPRERVRPRP